MGPRMVDRADRRAEEARRIDAAAQRLTEVLSDYAVRADVDDETRKSAAYILGIEGDGIED